ncbi:ead/Ea22-like family protein [Salmonella enterica]|nr:ead/Ea22-like family protein [Salmonella enterica]
MTALNKQALREAADKATKGQWAVEFDDEIYSTDGVNHEQIAMVFSENEASDAAFIAAANPATVLALLDELEKDNCSNVHYTDAAEMEIAALRQRIAELEARKVTIKLPADYRNSDGSINDDMFNTCAVVGAFRDALAAAGIGVKGE